MSYFSCTKLSLKQAVSKTMRMALFTAVVLFTAFSCIGIRSVWAAEGETALTVTLDGTVVKEFTLEKLEEIARSEGDGNFNEYNYSAWNVHPSASIIPEVHGPTVKGILIDAGVIDNVKDAGTIEFKAPDGYSKSLTGKQLLKTQRYYFPQLSLVDHAAGLIPDEAYVDAEEMPAVISTEEKDGYRLFVGQEHPNEENNPLFIKNMLRGGNINVSTAIAPKCAAVKSDPPSGSLVREGDEITLTSSNNYRYDKICFTLDESGTPGYGYPIYNCGPDADIEYRPVIRGEGSSVTLKVVVKGYGKQDSTVQRLTFYLDAVTVKVDGEIVKTFRLDELEALPDAGPYDYSGFNSFPTFSVKHVGFGKKIEDIIEAATGSDVTSYGSDNIIKFIGADGYTSVFTIGQLFGTQRFYFPKASAGTDNKGGKALPASYTGKLEVPAVVDMEGDNSLRFGQAAPNEQNFPECVSNLLRNGEIEIITDDVEKLDPISDVTPASGSIIDIGTRITLPELDRANRRNKVYYEVDAGGTAPGYGSAIYHYSPYNWPEKLFNQPVFNIPGKHTLSVINTAYGKKDSDVSIFTYYVRPAAPAGVKVAASTYNSIRLDWNGQSGASGYRIYKSVGGGSETLYKTVDAGTVSLTDTGLKTGTEYTYSITAYVSGDAGKIIEGNHSEKAGAKPSLKKPTIKLTAGKKKATIKWSKVAGASGYEIYRSTKKNKGFKKVATIKKGKTVKVVNKKLKKGKKYYYKVRAYRKVNGKKVYSSYSAVKKVKVK